ncbi:MAG: OmpA family protein [Alphaproteobacteria bacterium]|nr:OmpA family protein [Alphaproteobacteria bacterium]
MKIFDTTVFLISLLTVVSITTTTSAQRYSFGKTKENQSISVDTSVFDDLDASKKEEPKHQRLLFPSMNSSAKQTVHLIPDGNFNKNGQIILSPPKQQQQTQKIKLIERKSSKIFTLTPSQGQLLFPPAPKKLPMKVRTPTKKPKLAKKKHAKQKKIVHKEEKKPANILKHTITAEPAVSDLKEAQEAALTKTITSSNENKVIAQKQPKTIKSKAPEAQETPKQEKTHLVSESTVVEQKPIETTLQQSALSGTETSLLFDIDKYNLKDTAKNKLTKLLEQVKNDKKKHIRLLAYASATDGNTGKARRLSLSRALSVRSFLMEHGIHRSSKIEVRALGSNAKSGNLDRVDVIIVKR